MIFPLLLVAMMVNISNARPRNTSKQIPKELQEMLTRGGWTPTPSNSARYQIGDVFDFTTNHELTSGKECFSKLPETQPMANIEISRFLKGGFKIPLGWFRSKSKGKKYKRYSYANTEVREFSMMSLYEGLSEKCKQFLADEIQNTPNPSQIRLIKAVIQSTVNEQICTSFEASATLKGFGVEAKKNDRCELDTEAPVTIAYQLIPATEIKKLLGEKNTPNPSKSDPMSYIQPNPEVTNSMPVSKSGFQLQCKPGKSGLTFAGKCDDGNFKGLFHIALTSTVKGDFYGTLQFSAINRSQNFYGFVQEGFVNHTEKVHHGIQLGLVNTAGKVRGMQIGLYNRAEYLHGIQLGLLNTSSHNGLPFMIGINVGM